MDTLLRRKQKKLAICHSSVFPNTTCLLYTSRRFESRVVIVLEDIAKCLLTVNLIFDRAVIR